MRLRHLRPRSIGSGKCQVPFIRQPRGTTQRTGAAAVEFAMVAPIFFLVVFICIEFVRLNMIRNLTQDAAYFAARSAMVPGATADEAIAEANRILGFMNTQGANVVVNEDASGELNDDSTEISVTITVPMDQNSFLIPQFTGEITFTSTATMRTERYDGFYDPGA